MSSLKGKFLVASPDLHDPNFRQTVVLIVQHGKDGALGLVVNRATNRLLSEAWPDFSQQNIHGDFLLNVGGPCQGPLMALHNCGEMGWRVSDSLRFSGEGDEILELLRKEGQSVRLFVGYAGWSAGQLEDEIAAEAWKVAPASFETVFGDPDDAWRPLWRVATGMSISHTLDLRHVPKDLSLN